MSQDPQCKVAFIGTHGVGKTTLCYGLAARLKIRDVALEVVREVARRCPLPINQATSVESQSWILHTQIAEELAAQSQYGVVLCDRSILDNYVYMLVAAGSQPALEPMIDDWMRSYDLLLHVPIVTDPTEDGIRATDPAFQMAIDERLMQELSARGHSVYSLDPIQRDAWLETAAALVLDTLALPQLQLL